jgi:hypothetical protein
MPEVGKGKLLSNAANSPGPPLAPAAGLPGAALAGGAFLSSFLGGAPLAPAAAATYCCSSSSICLMIGLIIASRFADMG